MNLTADAYKIWHRESAAFINPYHAGFLGRGLSLPVINALKLAIDNGSSAPVINSSQQWLIFREWEISQIFAKAFPSANITIMPADESLIISVRDRIPFYAAISPYGITEIDGRETPVIVCDDSSFSHEKNKIAYYLAVCECSIVVVDLAARKAFIVTPYDVAYFRAVSQVKNTMRTCVESIEHSLNVAKNRKKCIRE